MKTLIQTEWVKAYDRIELVCQVMTQQDLAVSISLSQREIVSPNLLGILRTKREMAKRSLLDLVEQTFEEDIPELQPGKSLEIQI